MVANASSSRVKLIDLSIIFDGTSFTTSSGLVRITSSVFARKSFSEFAWITSFKFAEISKLMNVRMLQLCIYKYKALQSV